jgi:DEAD/DEAH box helicase domain-containing protein
MYPVRYITEGLWVQFPGGVSEGALHVVEHAIASAIPTIVKCSHSDFSLMSSTNLKEFDNKPTIVCYETGGGGAGIMEAIEERLLHILKKGLGILKACQCMNGCPNCTHLTICEKNNEPLDKAGGRHRLNVESDSHLLGKRSRQYFFRLSLHSGSI